MRKDELSSEMFLAFRNSFRALQGGMPLGDFARRLGMSQTLVRSYLDGTRFPDSQGLQKISDVCGVSVEWLLGRSNFRVKANANITAQDMGLSEKAAVVLQTANQSDHKEGPYPELVSSIIENKHFTRFIMQIHNYMARAEEVDQKLKNAAPSMRNFYAYQLKTERAAVAEVLGDLLNDMAPLPELEAQEKGKQ